MQVVDADRKLTQWSIFNRREQSRQRGRVPGRDELISSIACDTMR
jgi:hypothetical protein